MSSKKPSNLDVPSVMLSRDDVVSRSGAPGDQRSSGVRHASARTGSSIAAIAFVLLLGAVGFLYYELYSERQNMRTSEGQLKQAIEKLGTLGSQLNVQDQALSKTGGNVEKRLAELDSEVRKLWALSNKKNKTGIAQNKKVLSQHKLELSRLNENLKVTQQQAQQQLATSKKDITNTEGHLEGLRVRQVAFEKDIAQISTKVTRLSTADSSAELEGLQGRVEELELSIAAIDAHRAQVNRNLEKLRQALAQKNAKPL